MKIELEHKKKSSILISSEKSFSIKVSEYFSFYYCPCYLQKSLYLVPRRCNAIFANKKSKLGITFLYLQSFSIYTYRQMKIGVENWHNIR